MNVKEMKAQSNSHPRDIYYDFLAYSEFVEDKRQHGRNLMGDTGDVSPHFSRRGGHNMPCPPTFFSLGSVFGEVSKIKVMFVTFCVKSFSC